jgi:hypothetical protein
MAWAKAPPPAAPISARLTATQSRRNNCWRPNGRDAWLTTSEEQRKQVERVADQFLFMEVLIKENKINVTTDAAARFTKQLFGLAPQQPLPLDKFQDFVQNVLVRRGKLTLQDFDRFVRHQAAQQYLVALFGMSGKLITPKEAEFFYRRDNEPMATEIVFFPTANFYGATAPTDAELKDFFTKHQAEYRLPDREQINYVVFTISNYLAQADKVLGTNINDKIDQIYHQQGADTFKDASGQPLSPAAAQAEIKNNMRQMTAAQEAKRDANAFLSELSEGHDAAHPYAPSDLFNLAKAKGLIVKTTEFFDEKTGCKDLDLPPKALHVLFSLRENDPDDPEKSLLYAPSPLEGKTAVYIIGLQKRLPSELQTLAAVRDQVTRDWRQTKALALAKDAGEKFADALQVGATQGKTFDAICAAQNLKPQTPPPFALATTNAPEFMNRDEFRQLQETAYVVPSGQFSKFVPTADGGFVVYVKDRLPVDQAAMQRELPYYLARMREQRQMVAFQEWFNRQMQSRLVLPSSERDSPG